MLPWRCKGIRWLGWVPEAGFSLAGGQGMRVLKAEG